MSDDLKQLVGEEDPADLNITSADLSLATALVVEDQSQILSLICDCLATYGTANILRAPSADDAIETLERIDSNPTKAGITNVDFVIADWHLSGSPLDLLTSMNFERDAEKSSGGDSPTKLQGNNLIHWIRGHNRYRMVPVLGLSAYSSNQVVNNMLVAGVSSFLAKPFSLAQLSEYILRMVQDISPYIETPSGYFGPERRRNARPVSEERRQSQARVRRHPVSRALRNKTGETIIVSADAIRTVQDTMRELGGKDFLQETGTSLANIREMVGQLEPDDETTVMSEEHLRIISSISEDSNKILGMAGNFSYPILGRSVSALSRFTADRYFLPTVRSKDLMIQMLNLADFVLENELKSFGSKQMKMLTDQVEVAVHKLSSKNRDRILQLEES